MTSRAQPGNGLMAEWDLGESQWKDQMDANLRFLSGVTQLVLERADGTLPSSPTSGMLAMDTSGRIVGRLGSQWVQIAVPRKGWIAWSNFNNSFMQFDGTAWVAMESGGAGGGIPDAPKDGKLYGRQDEAWLEVPAGGGGGISEAPEDGKLYGRKNKAWEEVPEGGAGGGILEAPNDGKLYGRQNEAWLEVPAGGGGGIPDASSADPHVRTANAWQKLVPGTNVQFDDSTPGELKVSATGGGGGGAELMPWGGARIAPTATQNYTTTGTWDAVRFMTADYDTDGFWSPVQPNRLTIPAGVSRVRLYAAFKVDSSDKIHANNSFAFRKNGATNFEGNVDSPINTEGYTNAGAFAVSDAIEVSEGDYFELVFFTNQTFSLSADRGQTWFAVEILERTQSNATLGNLLDVEAPAPAAGQSLVFDPVSGKWKPGVPVVNVNQAAGLNKPFRGALVKLSDDAVVSSTPNLVGWHDVEYDTDGFWSAGEPSRITIPAGIKKVRLSATVQAQGTTSATENFSVAIAKAGSIVFVGNGWGANRSGYNDSAFTAHTAVIGVSQGDFFEVRFNKSTSGDVTLRSTTCSFSIEVVETEDPLP